MKATFEDFLTQYPLCKKYADNNDAIAVFEFLSKDENILRMIESSVAGKPALLGCLKELENYYDSLDNPSFQFNDNFVKSIIGRMVATIIAPFGYSPVGQVNFSQSNKGKYFGSANRYEKNREGSLRVVQTIERVLVNRELLDAFISEIASNPLKQEHLFISSFLKIKSESNKRMTASVQGVEDGFKKLLSAKGVKNKSTKFKKTCIDLTFTIFSHNQSESYFKRMVDKYKESNLFPHGTIFELFSDLRNSIDDVRALDVIENYYNPAQYECNLYGDKLYLRVSDFYYDYLKKHEENFNYDKCLKECLTRKKKSDDED